MPFGDGTGPRGLGPMTGRAAGYCAGYPVPGFMSPVPGRGFRGRGFGRGWGRGWRHRYWATSLPGWARGGAAPAWGAAHYGVPYPPQVSGEQELDWLKSQAEHLGSALEDIRAQMAEIEAESRKEEK